MLALGLAAWRTQTSNPSLTLFHQYAGSGLSRCVGRRIPASSPLPSERVIVP